MTVQEGKLAGMERLSEILQLLHEMDSRLTAAITAGIASVNLSIAQLSERHNASLLEQERKNSSFADRERVEALARQVHDGRNELAVVGRQVAQLGEADRDLAKRLDEVGNQLDSRSLKFLSGMNGYLVSLLVVVVSCVLTYTLTHLH